MGSTESGREPDMQCINCCEQAKNCIGDKVFVCLMEPKHAPSVAELEKLCFTVPWSEQAFLDELQKNPTARYFVLLNKANPIQVIAYGGYWKIFDEGHITNIAVHPDWRNQKAATYLLCQMIQFAKAEGIGDMTLEVRTSNFAAQAVYRKLGFQNEGIRKHYYEDTGEDAIIMWYRHNHKELDKHEEERLCQ